MFQIGDIVWIDKELYDTREHIVGKVVNIFPYFLTVRSDKGVTYSVHHTDAKFLHLIQKSDFESYGEKSRDQDIADALK